MESNHERLIAYRLGELSEDEKGDLERELIADPSLQSELESIERILGEVGDWMHSDPPGLEALDRLELTEPKVALIKPKAWNPLAKFAAQAIAASLIFFCGYLFGHETSEIPETVPSPEMVHAPTTVTPTVESAPVSKPRRGHHRTYEEDGRIIIETTLPASGGSAVWVVDGNFQLAEK